MWTMRLTPSCHPQPKSRNSSPQLYQSSQLPSWSRWMNLWLKAKSCSLWTTTCYHPRRKVSAWLSLLRRPVSLFTINIAAAPSIRWRCLNLKWREKRARRPASCWSKCGSRKEGSLGLAWNELKRKLQRRQSPCATRWPPGSRSNWWPLRTWSGTKPHSPLRSKSWPTHILTKTFKSTR